MNYFKVPLNQLVKMICLDCIKRLNAQVTRGETKEFEPCQECKERIEKPKD